MGGSVGDTKTRSTFLRARGEPRLIPVLLSLVALLALADPAYSSAEGPEYATINSATECKSYGYACTPGYTGSNASGSWAWRWYGGAEAINANGYHNCTLYAAWRLYENGMGDPGLWGNAVDWINHTSSNHTPAVGSIAWWGGEVAHGYGHVAYVEQVRGGEVFIRADNYIGERANGYTDAGWIPASSVDAFLHPHDVSGGGGGGSPTIHEGDFVSVSGHPEVYRIAGGAPLYVSNWSNVGGSHPVTTISAAQFAGLPTWPRDGTFIQGWTGGAVYEIAGGAPIPVSSWSHLGGSSGRTVIGVDRSAIDEAGQGGVWGHLRDVPADSTLIKGYGHAAVYVIAGGAPLAVSSWSHIGGQNGRSLTEVDQSAIDHAGAGGAWDHLRQVPADNTFVQPYSGDRTVYVVAGGAPLAVSHWADVGGSSGKSVVSIDGAAVSNAGEAGAWSHLRVRPADGTFIVGATGDRTVYEVAGGAPIAVSNWAHVGGQNGRSLSYVDPVAIANAGNPGAWDHLAAFPADGTILQSGPEGPLYETRAGAPYTVSALPPERSAVVVDPVAITNAGGSGVWRFLRAPVFAPPPVVGAPTPPSVLPAPSSGEGSAEQPAAEGSPHPAASGGGQAKTRIKLLSVTATRRAAVVRIRCAGSGANCKGVLNLIARRRSKARGRGRGGAAGASTHKAVRWVRIGHGTFDIAAGATGAVHVDLTRLGRAGVRRRAKLALRARISSSGRHMTAKVILQVKRHRHGHRRAPRRCANRRRPAC